MGGGVTSPSDPTTGRPDLTGRWLRLSSDDVGQRYPVEITFAEATYRGVRAEDQGFILWDAGTYRLDDDDSLTMSTASDELVAYPIVIDGPHLEVQTPEGDVAYERAEPPP
jgi:hypothetical protein